MHVLQRLDPCGPSYVSAAGHQLLVGAMDRFGRGSRVAWNWVRGTGEGRVKEVFTEPVERTIKGTSVKRNASEDEPAYLIEQDDGGLVLKSHSELRPA